MSLLGKDREVVECIKVKNTPTHYEAVTWPQLYEGNRYIMPKSVVQELEKEGFVKIIKA